MHWDLKEVLWDLFSETDNELSMQHAYPVHQEISDEILPMHYGRTFTRERKKRVKPAQLSSIRDLTQLNVCRVFNSPPFKGRQRFSGHVIRFYSDNRGPEFGKCQASRFSGFWAVQMCLEFGVPIFAIPLRYFMRPILSTQKGDSPEN